MYDDVENFIGNVEIGAWDLILDQTHKADQNT